MSGNQELEERIAFAELARDNVIAQLDELHGRVAKLRADHGERTSALVDLVRSLQEQLPPEAAEAVPVRLHEALRARSVKPETDGPDAHALACCEHARWSLVAQLMSTGFGREMLSKPFNALAEHERSFFHLVGLSSARALGLLPTRKKPDDTDQGQANENQQDGVGSACAPAIGVDTL